MFSISIVIEFDTMLLLIYVCEMLSDPFYRLFTSNIFLIYRAKKFPYISMISINRCSKVTRHQVKKMIHVQIKIFSSQCASSTNLFIVI